MSNPTLAWHFLSDTGKLRDGTEPPADGEWLKHDGLLKLCDSGLHASVYPLHALDYAPGVIVCRVECAGTVEHGSDKLVCSERKILWRADATDTLRLFARRCALDVIDLWDAPDVVREYLETGDDKLRDAAGTAARAAAGTAAWTAAGAAAGTAAGAATGTATGTAWDAARAATGTAAWDAWDAAWAAARAAQSARLTEMLEELA